MKILTSPAKSRGLCAGNAFILHRSKLESTETMDIDESFTRLSEELRHLAEKDSIFEAHAEIAEDPMLREAIDAAISAGLSVMEATDKACGDICAMFDELDDEYLQARKDDVKDVVARLKRILAGEADRMLQLPDYEHIILVAEEFYPSDLEALDLSRITGMVSEKGSTTSHVCIIAQTKGIPVLTGVCNCTTEISDGERTIIDAENSQVIISPDDAAETAFQTRMEAKLTAESTVSQINREYPGVKVYANAGSIEDVRNAIGKGAEGIGLFRSEFLFMESKDGFPDEQTQFDAYREAAEICAGKTLTIRTLDIGGDKHLPYYHMDHEDNPFLGLRAIRLCLHKPEIFKTQLRAILRASAYGNVRVMFPMLSTLEEWDRAISILDDCKKELATEKIKFNADIQAGMMVETPAAVLMAKEFASRAGFFSIGTNDLTQYIMASDRGNSAVSYLYRYDDPAVLSAISIVSKAAEEAGIEAAVCGEMASDKKFMPTLCSMGIKELSLNISAL